MHHKREIKLVLMDVQMPVMNGYESTTKIRQFEDNEEIEPGCYIIGVSGDESLEHERKCRMAGMNESMVKPLDRNRFEQILSILNHH